MDVHTIGHIGIWVSLVALIAAIPFALWGLPFFESSTKTGEQQTG